VDSFTFKPATNKLDLPIDYNSADWVRRKLAREQYCIDQNWKCHHCGCDLKGDPPDDIINKRVDIKLFPKTMFKYPIHLHHCHKTGMTIGAVHAKCNAVLWQYYGE
jgi:hypothetical protein